MFWGMEHLGVWNGKGHGTSRGMEGLRAWNVLGHDAMSQGMECQGACNVSGHAMSRGHREKSMKFFPVLIHTYRYELRASGNVSKC